MMHNAKQKDIPMSKIFAIVGLLCVLTSCAPDAQQPILTSRAPDAGQQVFATPEEAIDALVTATREDRKDELLKILGTKARQIIHSGDRVADDESRAKFIAADVLVVGNEEWPLPIPLVHAENGWWFDTTAGQEEILDRRIGRNELNAIEVCRVYVDAQQEFITLHDPHEYAQLFQSRKGQHDGLYWPTTGGQPPSPLGLFLANAAEEGYTGRVLSKHMPYHGYYYRILKSQGAHAAGGARDYVVNGHMVRGFGLIAFPARYDDSGVMTFIVNQNGIVYEKNLGFDTAEIARTTGQFEPDDSWNVVP
jgi:hypothetical protein